jgi:emfourin
MSDPRLRVRLVRSGGFAGSRVEVDVHGRDLPEAEARALEEHVDRADLESPAPRRPAGNKGGDQFEYDLTVWRGDAQHRVRLRDSEVPPTLRPLLQELLSIARHGGGQGSRDLRG